MKKVIYIFIFCIIAFGLFFSINNHSILSTFAEEKQNAKKYNYENKFLSKVSSILGVEKSDLSNAINQAKKEIMDENLHGPNNQIKSGQSGIIAVRVPGYSIIHTDPNARIWLHWNKEFETISASESDFSKFEGRSVIIAPTAEGVGNIIATPVGEKYSYELSASTLQTVIDGKQINRYDISLFVELVASVLLGILVILIARFTPYWFVGTSIIILYVASLMVACYLFNKHLILSDISWVIIVITIVGMHSIFNRFILEFKLKQQIRKQFETYLDPRQVAELQKDPSKLRLGGERKEMSFLFMDIVGFTQI